MPQHHYMKNFTLVFFLSIIASFGFAQERYNITELANVDFTAGNTEEGNDVWGYVDDSGLEYAIIGSTQATYIYSLENSASPVLRARIPGTLSTWRDIKDHNQYLYVVEDTAPGGVGDGLLVIDMSGAPTNITHSFYKPDVTVGGATTRLERAHNLYISDEGLLVLAGSNIFGGTPLFFDLSVDAEEPPFVGASRRSYAHDVYAENNLLYSSDIYAGQVVVHDYSNVNNITALGAATTTTTFTHNAWPTADDVSVFTTDEKQAAFVDSYDVTDPSDVRFMDKFRPDDTYDSLSIPHNTHVLGDYLATSWYEDGVVITDASRPHNMVEVGRYDTYAGIPPGSSRRFVGNWGAYPYLPSGRLLISDIQLGLFVLDVDYQRGCYFEGKVIDSVSLQPLSGVNIDFARLSAQSTTSDLDGNFATGIYEEGTYAVTFSRQGYITKTLMVDMNRGDINFQEIELVPLGAGLLTINVVDEDGNAINGAQHLVELTGSFGSQTEYAVLAGAWGFVTEKVRGIQISQGQPETVTVVLERGIYDDFVFDFDWSVLSTASTGEFVRDLPIGTQNNSGETVQLGEDVDFDYGGEAYVTGNSAGVFSDHDVDNGITTITSPEFDLSTSPNALMEFWYYFYNAGGNLPLDDFIEVRINNGTDDVLVDIIDEPVDDWTKYSSAPLSSLISLTETMTVSFTASDLPGSGHLVEAMIDAFTITSLPRPTVTFSPDQGCEPLIVTATSADTDADTEWFFEGADSENASGASPTVTYSEAGTYTVTVTLSDDQNGTASFQFVDAITVLPAVEADFRADVLGLSVDFFNLSIGAPDVLWDFGDGASSTEEFVQHIYSQAGTYTVTLTASGPCGSQSVSEDVTVPQNSSVSDLERVAGIQVVQNPISSVLHVQSQGSEDVNLVLRNAVGQVVLSQKLAAGSSGHWNVAHLASGTYFLGSDNVSQGSIPVAIVR